MLSVTRRIVLETLTKHEKLTIADMAKEENLGILPDKSQLRYLLHQLTLSGFIKILDGASPLTYTITPKGIEERNRLEMV
jgi:DNA-binding PadR family transcriptional regulator